MGVKGALALAELVKHPRSTLSDLLLGQNPLSSDGCVAIASAIQESLAPASERSVAAVAGASPSEPRLTLRYLDVTGVETGLQGAAALKAAAEAANAVLGAVSDGADSFDIEGLVDDWLPATAARPPSQDALNSRSEFTGVTMAAPASLALSARLVPPPSTYAEPLQPLQHYPSATPPVRGSPDTLPPSRQSAGSKQQLQPPQQAFPVLGKTTPAPSEGSHTPADSTKLLIDLLHRQLEEQGQQIKDLRDSLTLAQVQPKPVLAVAANKQGSPGRVDLADSIDDHTAQTRLSQALAAVAARGATGSLPDSSVTDGDQSFIETRLASQARPVLPLTDWGFRSAGLNASAGKRLKAVEARVVAALHAMVQPLLCRCVIMHVLRWSAGRCA